MQRVDFISCILCSAKEGFKVGDLLMSFKSVFQDVRQAVDFVHMRGELKKITTQNLSTYVVKDERLPMLMQRILDSGAKTFLLTNSEWWYTNEVPYIVYFLIMSSKNVFV